MFLLNKSILNLEMVFCVKDWRIFHNSTDLTSNFEGRDR